MPINTPNVSWEMTEASGNAIDSVASLALTDNNTVGSGTGLFNGSARTFNSIDEYFSRVTHSSIEGGGGALLIEAWVYPNTVNAGSGGTHQGIVTKGDWSGGGLSGTGNKEYGVWIDEAPAAFVAGFSPDGTHASFTTVYKNSSAFANNWNHVLAWQDPTLNVASLVANGVEPATTVARTGGVYSGPADLNVGRLNYSGGQYFDGRIQTVRIWKGLVPTIDDRRFLYNGGKGKSYARLSEVATASFVGTDTTTQGSWIGVYGSNGRKFPAGLSGSTSNPSYVGQHQVFQSTGGAFSSEFTWNSSTTDVRALQHPTLSNRQAVTWYDSSNNWIEFHIDVGSTAKQVAFYCLDWENAGRAMSVTVNDYLSGATLNTQSVSSYTNGKWLVWNISGHVKVRFTRTGLSNPTVSAVMFDPVASTGYTLTPAAVVSRAANVSPTVRLASLAVLPAASVARALDVSPTVKLGNVSVTAAASVARAVNVSPTVRQSSVSVGPSAVVSRAVNVSPTTRQGNLALTPTVSAARAVNVSPQVVAAGDTPVTPAVVSTRAVNVSPSVAFGNVTAFPAASVAKAVNVNPTVAFGYVPLTPDPVTFRAVNVAPSVGLSAVSVVPEAAAFRAVNIEPTVSVDDGLEPAASAGQVIRMPDGTMRRVWHPVGFGRRIWRNY